MIQCQTLTIGKKEYKWILSGFGLNVYKTVCRKTALSVLPVSQGTLAQCWQRLRGTWNSGYRGFIRAFNDNISLLKDTVYLTHGKKMFASES